LLWFFRVFDFTLLTFECYHAQQAKNKKIDPFGPFSTTECQFLASMLTYMQGDLALNRRYAVFGLVAQRVGFLAPRRNLLWKARVAVSLFYKFFAHSAMFTICTYGDCFMKQCLLKNLVYC